MSFPQEVLVLCDHNGVLQHVVEVQESFGKFLCEIRNAENVVKRVAVNGDRSAAIASLFEGFSRPAGKV